MTGYVDLRGPVFHEGRPRRPCRGEEMKFAQFLNQNMKPEWRSGSSHPSRDCAILIREQSRSSLASS